MADDAKRTVFRKVVVTEEQKKKYLVWNTPPYLGKPVELGKEAFTIGREEGRSLVIPSDMISRQHAEIVEKDGTFYIRDTNSSNGSYLNNAQLEPEQLVALKHTDILKFDQYEFIFVDSARADLWETLKPLNRAGAITVAFYSPKGGAGLTSLIINLAHVLSAGGKRVAVADFNLRFGDVLTYSQGKIGKSIYELSQEQQITGENIGSYMQKGNGFNYLPACNKIEYAELIKPDHAKRILWSLTTNHDYILVDLKNEIDEITLTTWEVANQVWLVSHPEFGRLLGARKILELMDKLKYSDKLKVLVNGVGRTGTSTEQEIRDLLKRPFSSLPYSPDDAILTSHQGQLYVKDRSGSTLANAVENLGRTIRGEEETHQQVGIFGKLKSMLGL